MTAHTGPDRTALLAVLGLPGDAVEPDITRSYRRLARRTHPDVTDPGHEPEPAGRRFAEISDAYHRLLELPIAPSPRPAPRPSPPPAAAVPPIRKTPPGWRRRPPIAAGPVIVTPPPDSYPGAGHGS